MSTQTFFNKISQVSTKELIDFLDHNKTEIIIKVLGQYIKTNIHSKKSDKHLSLPLSAFNSAEYFNEAVTCNFHYKEDRYFFKSHLNKTNSDYTLEVPSEIYQLQRRNNYRVAMPIGIVYKCEITKVNGVKSNISAEIRDISLGGCQISIAGITSDIRQNDEFVLYLKLGEYEFQNLVLNAIHLKFIDSQNTTLIGASLQEPESDMLSELQSMLMYLDRFQRGKTE